MFRRSSPPEVSDSVSYKASTPTESTSNNTLLTPPPRPPRRKALTPKSGTNDSSEYVDDNTLKRVSAQLEEMGFFDWSQAIDDRRESLTQTPANNYGSVEEAALSNDHPVDSLKIPEPTLPKSISSSLDSNLESNPIKSGNRKDNGRSIISLGSWKTSSSLSKHFSLLSKQSLQSSEQSFGLTEKYARLREGVSPRTQSMQSRYSSQQNSHYSYYAYQRRRRLMILAIIAIIWIIAGVLTAVLVATRQLKKVVASPDGLDSLRVAKEFQSAAMEFSPDALAGGACQIPASSNDMVAALNAEQFGAFLDPRKSPQCGACLEVEGPTGKVVQVKVVEKCGGCSRGSLSLSPAALKAVGGSSIKWRKCTNRQPALGQI